MKSQCHVPVLGGQTNTGLTSTAFVNGSSFCTQACCVTSATALVMPHACADAFAETDDHCCTSRNTRTVGQYHQACAHKGLDPFGP